VQRFAVDRNARALGIERGPGPAELVDLASFWNGFFLNAEPAAADSPCTKARKRSGPDWLERTMCS
jgi:hypothetical protein